MQAFLEVIDHQMFGNTVENYLVSALAFLGVLFGLPIGKAIILRHLKSLLQRTTNNFNDRLHEALRRIVGP
jgi:hypothetical protein